MLPMIDTHQHLWNLEQFSLPWLQWEGMDPLRRNYLISDYAKATSASNVSKTVYMEVDVAPEQRTDEANFVIGLCESEDNSIAGAVIGGGLGEDGFRAYIDQFKDNDHIKGIRHVLHPPETKPGTCLQEGFVKDVQYLGSIGMSFGICMRPKELGDAIELAEQCPDTLFILDSGVGNVQIVNGTLKHDPANPFSHTKEQWMRDVAVLGEHEHVVCKILGAAESAPPGWKSDTLAPVVNHCLDSFGPDRVVSAGNWPVCTLAVSFADWAAALREIISARPQADQEKLLSGNAERIYQLS